MNEEEAIKNVKEQLEGIKKANECGLATKGEFDKDIEAIETVLNLLEKKDKEIQYQKEINKTEQDRHKQTEKSLKGQLKKKDKMIDEIIGFIATRIWSTCPNEDCGANLDCENRCRNDDNIYEKCWKMYFERKLENEN